MLKQFFEENPRVALAFSGGVDSAWLLYCAAKYAREAVAYLVRTEFQPEFEIRDAIRLAEELGVPLKVIERSVLEQDPIRMNGADRCYHCKALLFSAIREQAAADGFEVLLDGSNADDDPGQRPGMRVLKELAVRSPLREVGLNKAEIRRLSREAGLFTHDKPSYSCLATRIPTDTPICPAMLEQVERGEQMLMELGFSDFRLRWRGEAARLELPEEQIGRAKERWEEITDRLSKDFQELTLAVRVP